MKQCITCDVIITRQRQGIYCSKCVSRIYRKKHPDAQKGLYKTKGREYYLKYKKRYAKKKNEKARQKYKENTKEIRQYMNEHRKKNLQSYKERDAKYKRLPKKRFDSAKRKAVSRNLSWDLTLEQYSLLISQPCHYCNNLFGKPVQTGAGLDRKNNSIGYEFTNVVSSCRDCNVMRNDILSYEETKQVIDFILKIRCEKNKEDAEASSKV